MLTQDEKNRIWEEEVIRETARGNAKRTKTKLGSLFNFLNTSVGGFVLTTIFWGGLMGLITWIINSYENKINDIDKINKIDAEIGYRYYQLFRQFDREHIKYSNSVYAKSVNNVNMDSVMYSNEIYNMWKVYWVGFKMAPDNFKVNTNYSELYSEFRNQNTVSLMTELRRLVEKRESLDSAKAITRAQWYLIENKAIPFQFSSFEEYAKAHAEAKDSIGLRRWIRYWPDVGRKLL